MERIKRIKHTDNEIFFAAKERWDEVAKPLGSLGLLEEAVQKIAAVQKSTDVNISSRKVVIMCADNGVTIENVTQSDSVVTAVCARAIAEGTSNINALAEVYGADVIAVDIGINRDVDCAKIRNRKIAYGTENIAAGPAMTRQQAEKSICAGMDMMRDLKEEGAQIVVTGEMGDWKYYDFSGAGLRFAGRCAAVCHGQGRGA